MTRPEILTQKSAAWIDEHLPALQAIRRDIHAHPELAGEEARTAALVASQLRAYGIDTIEGIGGYGVVGVLKGLLPGARSIGLRADMDALPIVEATNLRYASVVPGRMHACGHDGHTAMLLGAAECLAEMRDFAGTVYFIFQPAEENLTGAAAMIADGLFERFPCDAVFGLHNAPDLPAGRFAIRPGPMFASVDYWSAMFRGRGGHAGEPHRSQDVVYAQAQFVTALQGIVGRSVSPIESVALTVGFVAAGSPEAPNVIPAELSLAGSVRCHSADARAVLGRRLQELGAASAAAWGCSIEIDLRPGGVALVNWPEQTQSCVAAAQATVGVANVMPDTPPIMAAEDFALMLEKRPGALIGLGAGRADGAFLPLHTPIYDFNDAVIPYGVCFWWA
jgi:amidohydrolase